MAKSLLIGTIIILVVVIAILIIATFWLRADFTECENTESPWCPQFICPSRPGCTGNDNLGTGDCGEGKPAVRQSNMNWKST